MSADRPIARALLVALEDVCAAGRSSARSEALLAVSAAGLDLTLEEARRDRTSIEDDWSLFPETVEKSRTRLGIVAEEHA